MYRPVCPNCQKEYKVCKNDIWVIYLSGKPPRPTSIIMANMLECPICKDKMVYDFANRPTYNGDRGFNDLLQKLRDSKTDTIVYCYIGE